MEKMKASDPVADINVTPMVDVMLVLLIIFIVITPMLVQGHRVDMAKTKNPIADAGGRQGRRCAGRGQPRRKNVPRHRPDAARRICRSEVKDLLTNRLDKTVYVRADARARYERVVEVVDNLRAAGVDQLGLLTEEIQKDKAGSAQRHPAGM